VCQWLVCGWKKEFDDFLKTCLSAAAPLLLPRGESMNGKKIDCPPGEKILSSFLSIAFSQSLSLLTLMTITR
jgi:hypothetical protein